MTATSKGDGTHFIYEQHKTALGSNLSEQMTTLQNHRAESGSRLSLPLAPLSFHQPVRNLN